MKALLVTLAVFLSLNLLAAEVRICGITSDIDDERTDMFIEVLENGDIDSLRLIKTLPNGSVLDDDTFAAETVIEEGVVPVHREGRDILAMKVEDFSVSTGGIILVNYLNSGVNNSRRQMKLRLSKVGNEFKLTTIEGEKTNHLNVYGNWVPLIGLVGIKTIKAVWK